MRKTTQFCRQALALLAEVNDDVHKAHNKLQWFTSLALRRKLCSYT